MELQFTKEGDKWVSEFSVSTDFNLHIEGVKQKDIRLYQSTVEGGKYAFIRSMSTLSSPFSTVFDFDFSALLYPKYLKVVCATEPTLATVTEPEEPIEIIADGFEFNNLEEGEDWFGEMELYETQYGDYSDLFERLVTVLKKYGENYESSWYMYDWDTLSKYVRITVNEYNVTGIYYYEDNDYIDLDTDGPFGINFGTGCQLTKESIRYYTFISTRE